MNIQNSSDPSPNQKKEREDGDICTENASSKAILDSGLEESLSTDLPSDGWGARQDKEDKNDRKRQAVSS
jgi:hypothetical protein